MAFDPDYILNREFPAVRQTYTEKDCILYALGVGMGIDPLDEECLRFVYEKDLKVVPSQSVMMAHPGFWADQEDLEMDWIKIVHIAQEVIFHQPLPSAATVEAKNSLTECIDRGARVGAVIVSERTVSNVETGEDICTLITTILARGNGGFSDDRADKNGKARLAKKAPKDQIPDREPDYVCDLPTLPQQALIYRLSGDFNPLHASPTAAQDAGFDKPLLHGLCTMGVVTHALLKTCCDYDPDRFKHMRLRFSAPVYPGETIRTEVWRDGETIAFRARSVEQDKVVINNGYLRIDQ